MLPKFTNIIWIKILSYSLYLFLIALLGKLYPRAHSSSTYWYAYKGGKKCYFFEKFWLSTIWMILQKETSAAKYLLRVTWVTLMHIILMPLLFPQARRLSEGTFLRSSHLKVCYKKTFGKIFTKFSGKQLLFDLMSFSYLIFCVS